MYICYVEDGLIEGNFFPRSCRLESLCSNTMDTCVRVPDILVFQKKTILICERKKVFKYIHARICTNKRLWKCVSTLNKMNLYVLLYESGEPWSLLWKKYIYDVIYSNFLSVKSFIVYSNKKQWCSSLWIILFVWRKM